jgi:DNA helicase II / ATP-dependent DNA helicase PcrA
VMSPLKFHLTQQARSGDAHVYGGRSRFMTDKVLKCFDAVTFRTASLGEAQLADVGQGTLDIGARLKEMW